VGVDRALLHRQLYMGVSNEYIADCVARYPARLQGLAHVEEWWVRSDPDRALAKLDRAFNEFGLSGLQFLPFHLSIYGQDPDWDHPDLRAFWDHFAELGVPLFMGFGASGDTVEFAQEVARLRTWMERYPDVSVVLTHGFNADLFRDGEEFVVPDHVLDAAPVDNPGFHAQVTFAVFVAERWDYPLPQVRPALAKLVERMGPDRLLWGSDIPVVLLYLTYRQTLDYIRLYCDFLSPADIDKLMGGNMARLMGIAA
jgi:predicted TIM-barrel fold metal-dependent hydrolase